MPETAAAGGGFTQCSDMHLYNIWWPFRPIDTAKKYLEETIILRIESS